MKKCLLYFFLLPFFIFSQNSKLDKVDKIIYSYMPVNSIEELAKRIDYDFPTKEEKTRISTSSLPCLPGPSSRLRSNRGFYLFHSIALLIATNSCGSPFIYPRRAVG